MLSILTSASGLLQWKYTTHKLIAVVRYRSVATNIYASRHENQRERILEVAKDLFIEKGIEQITIGDIARAAQLTRTSVFQYFGNKEELAQEIFKNITQNWRDRNSREVWNFKGTGHERLENFIISFFNYLYQTPKEAKLVAEINYIYARRWSAQMFVETTLKNLAEDRKYVAKSIQQGFADGSLRQDIDPELLLAAFFNFLSGMIGRMGEMGDKVGEESDTTTQTIFTQIARIFLDGLKAQ